MKRLSLLIILCLPASFAAADTPVAFVNVNVLPMIDERVVRRQTVVIDDATIVEIGDVDSVPVPADAVVVDGTDRFLMPGLAEMHAHLPGRAAADLDRTLTLFAANGVTTARSMLGQRSHLALRDELAANRRFGPRLVVSGPSFSGGSVDGVDDVRARVRTQHAAGYDFLKLHPGLTADEFHALAETASEVGIPFAGHVPVAVGVRDAVAAGMATIDHLDGYLVALLPRDADAAGGYGGFFDVLLAGEAMPEAISELAAATAAGGTWNVPTQALFEHRVSPESPQSMRRWPEMRYMPAATVDGWVRRKQAQFAEPGFDGKVAAQAIELRRRMIRALHEAGAGLLLGSDAPQVFNVPGFALHRELQFLVASGLTPFEALATGTTAVADFLGSNGGRVAPGRDADLVLLDASPLDDIGNSRRIHGVMLRGAWYPRADLDARLDRLE